jgi:hypothetical protein
MVRAISHHDTLESAFFFSLHFALRIHRKGKEYIELTGTIEAPKDERHMGGYVIGVYTAEQQARLSVDDKGNTTRNKAAESLDPPKGLWFNTEDGSDAREEVQQKVDELIKSTLWWKAYCGAVKAKVLSLVHNLVVNERYEEVVLVMVCIKGGPVTEVEARNMEALRKECLEDLGEGKKSRPKGLSLVSSTERRRPDGTVKEMTSAEIAEEMAQQRAAMAESSTSTCLALKIETLDWFGDLQWLVTGDLDGMDSRSIFRNSDLVDEIVEVEEESEEES